MHGLPHLVMPFWSLFGQLFSGTFAFMRRSFRFFCLLKSVKGGWGMTYAIYSSWYVIDLQCLACIFVIEGSRGSYLRANIGLFVPLCFFLMTLLRPFCLGTDLALSIAELISLTG